MKRLTALALTVLLVLCGCSAQPEPATTPPATDPSPATEPIGIYDPESKIERITDGAIKAYPLGMTKVSGFSPMGSDILLFSGEEETVLSKLSGDDLHISAAAALPRDITPRDPAVQVNETGVTYYDAAQKELVFLDSNLQESKRITLPGNLCGSPAISADLQRVYYCTSDALRCTDLETGLDRLIKEMYFSQQSPTALHCDDTVIVCDVNDEAGRFSQLYIRIETGELLYETLGDTALATCGTSYFAQHIDGIYTELLIGSSEHGPTLLTPHTYGSSAFPLLEIGGAALVTADDNSGSTVLDYYDLPSGRRTSSVTLPGVVQIRDFQTMPQSQTVWYLCEDAQYGCDVLYCWDLSKTAVSDDRACLSSRYSSDHPDLEGLVRCREIADELSNKYDVQIFLWDDATAFQPWDYTLIPEYQVPVIRENLKMLEQFLSQYPKGFLQKAAERTTSGRIQICLVRRILGNETASGAVQEAVGLQYWDENRNTYLCLAVQQKYLAQHASHEMSHIIDSRVLTFCKAYDDWSKLNPAGFKYTYGNIPTLSQEDRRWTIGAEQSFIDAYSMTYPKEDRARIMEYAMMSGREHCFQSETMQKKLRTLCLGIRQAFQLENCGETFLWEQYLEEPLNQK